MVDADEFELRDLRRFDECLLATRGIDHVYALAADMGGMGFISANHATILRNNALINIHTLEAARVNGASRYLFSSSACVYPEHLQTEANVVPLREEDAYPANPQDAYGWEKLLAERLCLEYTGEFGLDTRIVRFHNIYGPYGTYDGGREKVPAALCRKVAAGRAGRGDRDLGRRGADAVVLLRRRLRRGDLPAHAVGLPGAAQSRQRRDGDGQRARRDDRRRCRARTASRCDTSTAPRVCAVAIPTTAGCVRCWAGSRRSPSARDLSPPIAGSRSRWSGRPSDDAREPSTVAADAPLGEPGAMGERDDGPAASRYPSGMSVSSRSFNR